MSTAEVEPQPDNNANSAQDVQNMLAELKGENKPEAIADSTSVEKDKAGQASNDDVKVLEKHDPVESNGVKDSGDTKEEEAKEEKRADDADGDGRERSGGHRPFRGGSRGRGGGRGRGNFKSYKENIKSDFTTQQETDDPIEIRKQVEFYFSDSNLPMDKFLLSQVGGSKNLPVDLKIIHSFKRMRHFQPFSAIVVALKESKFLELTDDDTKIRRREPLPDKIDPEEMDPDSIKVFEDRAMPRSVYVKGFGEEDSTTQFDIEAFFTPYGPWNAIRLRRAHDKVFKSSVFVEFDSEETQQKFLELDPKPKYKDEDLQIMSKKAYCQKKVDDINSGKLKRNGKDYQRGRGDYQSKRKRDDEDDRDWRERRDSERNNGFRDSRRGRGGRGRDSKREQGTNIRRDARGVPIITTTEDTPKGDNDSRSKREAATADALAKAKAMVEAENVKKEGKAPVAAETTKAEDANVKKEGEIKASFDGPADAVTEKSQPSTGIKRGRGETENEGLPDAKRVDSKVEADGKESKES